MQPGQQGAMAGSSRDLPLEQDFPPEGSQEKAGDDGCGWQAGM